MLSFSKHSKFSAILVFSDSSWLNKNFIFIGKPRNKAIFWENSNLDFQCDCQLFQGAVSCFLWIRKNSTFFINNNFFLLYLIIARNHIDWFFHFSFTGFYEQVKVIPQDFPYMKINFLKARRSNLVAVK